VDSSSSLESLSSVANHSEDVPLDAAMVLASVVPPELDLLDPPLRPPLIPSRPRPLPPPGHRSTITAFTSYVRRRGEPDGRTSSVGEASTSTIPSFAKVSHLVRSIIVTARRPKTKKLISQPLSTFSLVDQVPVSPNTCVER